MISSSDARRDADCQPAAAYGVTNDCIPCVRAERPVTESASIASADAVAALADFDFTDVLQLDDNEIALLALAGC